MGWTSQWFHGNSIPKIGCHYLWSGPITVPNDTLPVDLDDNFQLMISLTQTQTPNRKFLEIKEFIF
jgi:hypothetical protein